MRRALLIAALCLGCGPDFGDELREDYKGAPLYYGGEVFGMELRCGPECPPIDVVAERLIEIERQWAPHMPPYHLPFAPLEGARVLWLTEQPKPGAYGVHWRYEKRIELWMPKEERAFPYEVSHLYHFTIDPDGTEAEWIEWRKERGL